MAKQRGGCFFYGESLYPIHLAAQEGDHELATRASVFWGFLGFLRFSGFFYGIYFCKLLFFPLLEGHLGLLFFFEFLLANLLNCLA